MSIMRKIPKFNKTELCFVKRILSQSEQDNLFTEISSWAKNHNDEFFGFYCMNYGLTELRLNNTIFYIWRSRNKKNILENNKNLITMMKGYGFSEIKESAREIDSILKLLNIDSNKDQ